jgi:hypothetical protein
MCCLRESDLLYPLLLASDGECASIPTRRRRKEKKIKTHKNVMINVSAKRMIIIMMIIKQNLKKDSIVNYICDVYIYVLIRILGLRKRRKKNLLFFFLSFSFPPLSHTQSKQKQSKKKKKKRRKNTAQGRRRFFRFYASLPSFVLLPLLHFAHNGKLLFLPQGPLGHREPEHSKQ